MGPWLPWPICVSVVVGGAGLLLFVRQPLLLAVVLVGTGLISGSLANSRIQQTLAADMVQGRGVVTGLVLTDPRPYGDNYRFLIRPTAWQGRGAVEATPWNGPALAVVSDQVQIAAGDHVTVSGLARQDPEMVRGDPVAGRITATDVAPSTARSGVAAAAGNAIRRRVQSRLEVLGGSAEAALLGGFLIGDIAMLPDADNDALRRAGLTHYVAVSGSNVALVLGAWWLAVGLTGAGPRTRSMTGLAVLLIFVIVTRWESSVIRAATMAALVIGGRSVGVSIDAWTALGGAVSILLVVSGDLAFDVGFQLSVGATAGVLMGMHIWSHRSPKLCWSVLAATVSAQLAVVPLLLIHFGTVPLLSPVANLLAAPLVTGATMLSGVGVILSWDAPLFVAQVLSTIVLRVASTAAGWPQLDVLGVVALAGWLGLAWPTRLRWAALAPIVVLVAAAMIPPGPPTVPTAVWLDVGQGDSVVLRDPSGAVVLVDGGREPLVLSKALSRYGIKRVDLMVATHGDADHIGGFSGIFEDLEVDRLWVPAYVEPRELLAELIEAANAKGVVVDVVASGESAVLSELEIEVHGPRRRFAEENDGSVVLMVAVGDVSVLLPGDIGVVAQQGLDELRPSILMVPHHGAATSDIEWLAKTVGSIAIVSVGPNTYGHPAPEVVAVLSEAGARVLTTWDRGDIEISLR